jgi:hypothetical protein
MSYEADYVFLRKAGISRSAKSGVVDPAASL